MRSVGGRCVRLSLQLMKARFERAEETNQNYLLVLAVTVTVTGTSVLVSRYFYPATNPVNPSPSQCRCRTRDPTHHRRGAHYRNAFLRHLGPHRLAFSVLSVALSLSETAARYLPSSGSYPSLWSGAYFSDRTQVTPYPQGS